MFFRKKDLYVDKLAESVKPKDPLYQFKKATRGELGRYSVEGEVWKAVRKLALLALLLALGYVAWQCYLAIDIFQK